MFKFSIALFLLLSLGCDTPPKVIPPPTHPHVKFSKDENTTTGVCVTIIYTNNDDVPNCRVFINKLEELSAYKKELEFLMLQLEDAEKRMQIYEQSDPTKIDVTGVPTNSSSSL